MLYCTLQRLYCSLQRLYYSLQRLCYTRPLLSYPLPRLSYRYLKMIYKACQVLLLVPFLFYELHVFVLLSKLTMLHASLLPVVKLPPTVDTLYVMLQLDFITQLVVLSTCLLLLFVPVPLIGPLSFAYPWFAWLIVWPLMPPPPNSHVHLHSVLSKVSSKCTVLFCTIATFPYNTCVFLNSVPWTSCVSKAWLGPYWSIPSIVLLIHSSYS